MIGRIWHGYTTPENEETYENLLKEEIFIGIRNRHIPGFQEIQLLRRNPGPEVEFVTIMWFDTLNGCARSCGARRTREAIEFRRIIPGDITRS